MPLSGRNECENGLDGQRNFYIGDARMLVISRKIGQAIMIGNNIAVTVVRIGGKSVRIGIDAPTELHVVRDELKPRGNSERADDGTAI